jgi:predicted transcriptional regulator
MRNIFLFWIGLNIGFCLSGYAQENSNDSLSTPLADTLDAAAVLRGETPQAREQRLRYWLFMNNLLAQGAISVQDSTLVFRLQQRLAFSLSPSELRSLPPRVDYIEDRFRREELGLPPMSNLNNLFGAGVKFLADKLGMTGAKQPFAVIPSETEIEVMNVLWKKHEATTGEIYAELDSAQLTAVDLQQMLATMTERGLLDREQISPRHEFSFFGVVAVEMSSQNRKNREYLYRPNVTRQSMLSYLDATAFSQRLVSPANHSLIVEHLRKLMSRLAAATE